MSSGIISDTTPTDVIHPKGMGTGYDPSQYVPTMFSPPSEMKLIPESEWVPRIRDRKKYKTGLRDMFKAGRVGTVKDQNGQGYCWAYSVVRSVEYVRAIQNPLADYTPLSAHSVGCKVKNFRDEGGWCGLSAQYIREYGVVPESLWPAKSMNRKYDTPEAWAEAAKYKITEDYVNLNRQVWDQQMTWQQVVTCLLNNIPVIGDYNWWGHSVLLVDLDVLDGEVCPDGDNSWTPNWGDNGTFRLQGQRKYPNGAVGTRSVNPT